MELWFTEKQTPSVSFSCKTNRTLVKERTPYQELALIDTEQFGRMLVLDGMVQTTVKDEFIYHEMITWPALNTHPDPRQVLVIGGGDGGTIREIVKHPRVEKATLVEIDRRVIEVAREYLPEISCALSHPKVEILVQDGMAHVRENKDKYDIIIVDSTEPVGPAVGLFSEPFYRDIYGALKEDGLFVAQTESPFFNDDLIRRVFASLKGIFPLVRLYLAYVPTYPSGMWSFTMGSKKYDPLETDGNRVNGVTTRYYTPQIQKSAFQLPVFVEELLV